MTDPAQDAIAAAIRAITGLVTGPPNLIGFDFADLRVALLDTGRAVFGQGEAEGPDRARRAVDASLCRSKAAVAPVACPSCTKSTNDRSRMHRIQVLPPARPIFETAFVVHLNFD
jgi:hypothetical protein